MRLVIHRVDVAMFQGDYRVASWREHHFEERPRRAVEHESGRETLWSRSKPFEVEAPALSKLADVDLPRNEKYQPAVEPARRRLVTPTEKWGYDATSVLHLAVRGEGGFRMAPVVSQLASSDSLPTATLEEATWRLADLDLPEPVLAALDATGRNTLASLTAWVESGSPAEGPMQEWGADFHDWAAFRVQQVLGMHSDEIMQVGRRYAAVPPGGITLDPEPTATRWGIAFAPRGRPGDRTFLASASVAPRNCLASTRDLSAVASWDRPEQAEDWAHAAGLNPEEQVPIAGDGIYPSVAEIPAELGGDGEVWELSRASTEMLTARANPSPTAEVKPAPLLQEISPPPSKPLEIKRTPSRTKVLPGQLAFNW